MTQSLDADQLDRLLDLARAAGVVILRYYGSKDLAISYKADKSPVTAADHAAHDAISAGLSQITPKIPVISEESDPLILVQPVAESEFWLVDPLDGTKEFIGRTGEFTVNIALIADGSPTFGLVYAPTSDELYYAMKGGGSFRTHAGRKSENRTRAMDDKGLKAYISRSHRRQKDLVLKDIFPDTEFVTTGSAIKYCEIAAGKGDIVYRSGPTYEWDTAAAQCIIEEAGGCFLDLTGKRLSYNKPAFLNPAFVAFGDKDFKWRDIVAR